MSFKVGDKVRYVGMDLKHVVNSDLGIIFKYVGNGDLGEVKSVNKEMGHPNISYHVSFNDGKCVALHSSTLELCVDEQSEKMNFKVGDKVRYIGVEYVHTGLKKDDLGEIKSVHEDHLGVFYRVSFNGEICVALRGNKLELCVDDRESFIDYVNHPPHYTSHPSGVECIEIIRHMTFNAGNAVKYLWRAGLKDGEPDIKDLKKAVFYIQDEIKRLSSDE